MSYKRWILVAVSIFSIGLILGLVTLPSVTSFISRELDVLEEFGGNLVPFTFLTAILIFAKNVLAMLVSFFLSPILCLTPILALALNGCLLSYVSVLVVQEESISYVLAGLLPHGVLEIPALIMAQAAALSFGTMTMLAIFKKEKRQLLLPNFKQNLKYLAIALALLLPAAIIETYVTPLLLK